MKGEVGFFMRVIDKVIYLNLVRRPDRRAHILGEFVRNGFPEKLLHHFKARDGFDYPTTESICAAMVADGFGKSVSRRLANGLGEYTGGDFACLWSKLCMFRWLLEAADEDSVWMFMEDDCVIKENWDFFSGIVGSLPGDFRILQLDYWCPEQFDLVSTPSPTYTSPIPYNAEVFHGFGGIGEHALIMTPSGARQLLAWSDTFVAKHYDKLGFHLDLMLWERSFDFPAGCYYLSYDHVGRLHPGENEPDDSDRAKWRARLPDG